MKFLPSRQSAKASLLAAIAIVTSIASNVTPSKAAQPISIIQTPGKPALVIFGNSQSFEIGCPSVRNIWSQVPTEQVNLDRYQQIRVTAKLACNAPSNQVLGYTSSAFEQYGYAGAILLQGVPYLVRNKEVYQALGITPLADNNGRGGFYLASKQKTLRENTVFEVQSSLPPLPLLPEIPSPGSIFPPSRPPVTHQSPLQSRLQLLPLSSFHQPPLCPVRSLFSIGEPMSRGINCHTIFLVALEP